MGKKVKKVLKSFKKMVKKKPKKQKNILLIPTGSTTLNLECSGTVEGAFQAGKLVNLIGDSSSGKSFISLSSLAECSIDERFDAYRLIYDDVEAANEFDIEELFGSPLHKRLELKHRSSTIEEFNDKIAHCLDENVPFIYVLDSFDALTSEAFKEKDDANRKKRDKGQDTTGSYGDGKARIFSDFCKNRIRDLKDTKSLLIIISQTRDNIGFGARFNPKTRSGGNALRFYSCHEIWLDCTKKIKKGKRILMTNVRAKITKNKLTGDRGEAYFPILRDYGIDDMDSCITFMIEEGTWSGPKNSIDTKGFVPDDKTSNAKLLALLDGDKNKQQDLRLLCQSTYESVLADLKPDRTKKY